VTKFILRRLIIVPPALVLAHFLAYAYAVIALPIRAARTPNVSGHIQDAPLWELYRNHIQSLLSGEVSSQFGGPENFWEVLTRTTLNSLGLLLLAMLISIVIGLILGLQAVRTQPPGTSRWLTVVSTIGLAMPSFYLGSLFILAIVFYVLWKGPGTDPFLPIKGFGWDIHLVLPTLALVVRPTVQIAQVSAELLSTELRKQYIVAARSIGHTWRRIRWHHAMRNVIAPVILTVAASLRLLVGELIVVEWLFNWPGLGNLLASTLVPGRLSTSLGATDLFLNPAVIAAVVMIITAIFLTTDLVASVLTRMLDPRMRANGEGELR
jgi:peptide/nickel transport system permease protein